MVVKYSSLKINVFELYGKIDVPKLIGNDRYTNDIQSEFIDYGTFNEFSLDLLKQINEKRINNGHIKSTPNNPVSSRGHLFFKCNFILENGKNVSVILIDSAGIENPFMISKVFLKIDKTAIKLMNFNNIKLLISNMKNSPIKTTYWDEEILEKFKLKYGKEILNNFGNKMKVKNLIKLQYQAITETDNIIIRNLFLFNLQNYIIKDDNKFIKLFDTLQYDNINIDKVCNYIHDVITEGFFIVETLNHLKYFFRKRLDKQTKVINITARDFFIGTENLGYSINKFFISPEDPNNLIKMTDYLKKLNPKTKYIISGNIRTDLNEIICGSTLNGLDFLNSIKST